MKDVNFFIATAKSNIKDTLIYKFVEKEFDKCNFRWVNANTQPLSELYNKEIQLSSNKNKILVFLHDDCIPEDLFIYKKLNEAMQQFDIVGLAGIQAPITIKPPLLWHLMGPANQYSGAVAHFNTDDNNQRFMTAFGVTPKRCIIVDGVFLAINVEKILEKGVKFDEKCPAKFHFYDINFCLDANKAGLKIGTYPIWITHKSHGLSKPNEDWFKGQDYCLQKYCNM
jgi:GT2 family glycosyltransferase